MSHGSHQAFRGRYLGHALGQAMGRLEPLAASHPGTAFGPLGEALFWLVALDDLLEDVGGELYRNERDADDAGRLMRGLRYARNQVAHGTLVATLVDVNPDNAVLDVMILDQARLDTPIRLIWLARREFPEPTRDQRGADEVYDAELAGKPLLDTLARAVRFARTSGGV